MKTLNFLKILCHEGKIRPLDYQFSKKIRGLCSPNLNDSEKDVIAYTAAITSFELSLNNICVPLAKIASHKSIKFTTSALSAFIGQLPETNKWLRILSQSGVCSDGSQTTPLVYDNKRIYLFRYWQLEKNVASKLLSLSKPKILSNDELHTAKIILNRLFTRNYDLLWNVIKNSSSLHKHDLCHQIFDFLDVKEESVCHLDIDSIFQTVIQATNAAQLKHLDQIIPESHCINWQKVAASVAISKQLSVISGGPGTGKTTTVSKLLAAMCEIQKKDKLIIKLCAPTGKAAARLTESISEAMSSLPISTDVKNLIPTEASTIHRLLGAVYKKTDFRHNAKNKLHLDILVIDEASMIDLVLISKLLDAIPDNAIVIFLGDKNQLASVEAGSVFGDMCTYISDGFSQPQSDFIKHLTGYNVSSSPTGNIFSDSLCMLKKSYRFHENSGIGQLSFAINASNIAKVNEVLLKNFSDVHYTELSAESYNQLISDVSKQYAQYLNIIKNNKSKSQVLSTYSKTRLICATREGECGVKALNYKIERKLELLGLITTTNSTVWYVGRPIMITKNDHTLGLYNGDIGICMRGKDGLLYVFFESSKGEIRRLLPSRLPEHETNFAMTIHKSQGSEFINTYVLLPEKISSLITQELLYTGITRAKKNLYLYALRHVLDTAVINSTIRTGGLVNLLSTPS